MRSNYNGIRRATGGRPLSRRRPSAFTVIELLVAAAIISIIVSMLAPALKNARNKARSLQCVSNMRQFGVAFQLYMDQNAGWMPANYYDDTYNWQSMLVDNPQGGNYFGNNNDFRSRVAAPVCVRISTRILCPTTVANAITAPLGTVAKIADPHFEWGYSYNHVRCSIPWQAEQWPWFRADLRGVDLRVLYPTPSNYIVMTDGNGANYNPDDWDATTGSLGAFNYPIQPVHGDGVNSLFMDGHVQYMNLQTAADKSKFNTAFYGGVPLVGNPYLNY